MVKVVFPEAYDKESWLYLRLMLIHLYFNVPFVNKIMNCMTLVTFSNLINGAVTKNFKAKIGSRKRFP